MEVLEGGVFFLKFEEFFFIKMIILQKVILYTPVGMVYKRWYLVGPHVQMDQNIYVKGG